ncbi:hypothetical protein CBOM_05264 [Ceraceosorus bombacis]|uniref:Uncharacterized protein n=1 Tax=Ceraceosorus bombacis TaxID=401625 RepID=A0A0P1BRL5_9BASI|nr:hypothetical protein CBOM_05264 [Ceraceosorus bombacis]
MLSLSRGSAVEPAVALLAAVASAQDPNSMSRVININSVTDFCVYAPPNGGAVADFESSVVSYCTKSGYGTRLIPQGTITGAHFVKTPHYVQVTGNGDFTKIGITPGDAGGELDPHGAEGTGNPVGGVVYTNNVQTPEWMHFMSATDFCFRACFPGNRATSLCRHTYDVLGCGFNMPGNYASGVFEECDGNDAQDIMYGYPGLSSFQQDDTSRGVAVPSPHPAPASSNCSGNAADSAFSSNTGASGFAAAALAACIGAAVILL